MRVVAVIIAVVASLLAAGGCAKPGVLFPPLERPMVWPDDPDTARVAYVGQLTGSDDLKPGVSGFDAIGRALFGKKESHYLLSPFAAATDGGDRLFVADTGAQVVHVFDLKARKYARWTPKVGKKQAAVRFTQPVGLAWDPAGRLLVSDSIGGTIFAFDTDGQYIGQMGAGILYRPSGIAFDARTGRIFVADVMAHQIVVLNPDGTVAERLGTRGERLGEFNYPTNVALDSTGRLYVSDSLNFRVQQFSPDLKPVRQIGAQGDIPGYFQQPKGIAVDGDDHLYVVDSRFENVQIFDAEGRLLLFFGEEGTGPGRFWLPAGIHIDRENRIWIADTYNRRVEVFDYVSRPEGKADASTDVPPAPVTGPPRGRLVIPGAPATAPSTVPATNRVPARVGSEATP